MTADLRLPHYTCCYCGKNVPADEVEYIGDAYDIGEAEAACYPCAEHWGWLDA